MEIKNHNILLKTLRKSRNMTQVELANEICSVKELQRIEKGTSSPGIVTYKKLLTRLGVDITHNLYSFANENEQLAYNQIAEIENLLFESKYTLAQEKFSLLEMQDYFDANDLFIKQFALICKSLFLYGIETKTEAALKTAYQAINVTINNFNLEYIDRYLLIPDEYSIINTIAILYKSLDDINKAIDILRQLIHSINQNFLSVNIRIKLLPIILYNLSKYLGENQNYEEAIIICDEGIKICREACTFRCLGEFFYNKAAGLYFLNDIAGAKINFKYAYDTFIISGNNDMLKIIIKNAIDRYGISISDIKF